MSEIDHFQPEILQQCLKLAAENVGLGRGGPFAAVVVKNGKIIGQGVNKVLENQDPTAHAEIIAIRDACAALGHFQLDDCYLYTSCEPCPMCLGAIYWARPKAVFYAASSDDAARSGFDDSFIYKELALTPETRKIPAFQFLQDEGLLPFHHWLENPDKNLY